MRKKGKFKYSSKNRRLKDAFFDFILPVAAALIVDIFILAQPHLSCFLIVGFVTFMCMINSGISWKSWVIGGGVVLVFAIAAGLIFYLAKAFLFDQAIVDGISMVPTLEDGQKLLYSKIYTPEDNDIVIVHNDQLDLIVKRVVATGGQTVDIRDGIVYVDGEQLDEQVYEEGSTLTASHYVNTLTPPRNVHEYPVTVPEGYVFVMGDNRGISEDSRGAVVGFVPEEDVIGKVFLRYSPWKEFKIFNY